MAGISRWPFEMSLAVLTVFLTGSILCTVPVQCVTTESTTNVNPTHDPAVIGERTADGICQCTVNYPAVVTCTDYEVRSTSRKLVKIRQQVENLTLEVNRLNEATLLHSQLFADFRAKMEEVTTTFDLIGGGQVLVTRAEIEGVRTRIQNMTSTLRALRQWYGVESGTNHLGRIRSIIYEAGNISQIVDEITAQDALADLAAMEHEITVLTNQLQMCTARASRDTAADATHSPPTVTTPHESSPSLAVPTAVVTAGDEPGGDGGGDHGSGLDGHSETVPELWPRKKKQDSCNRLLKISEPYTLRGNLATNGTWMRDPTVNPQFVYYHSFPTPRTSSSYSYVRPPTEFRASASITSFQKSLSSELSGVSEDTLESVVFNGSVFVYSESRPSRHRYSNSRANAIKKLSKIALSRSSVSTPAISGSEVTQRSMQNADLDLFPYMAPVSVPNLDLTLDDSGVWLLYGNSLGLLTVSKLNQDTLLLGQTWEGSFPKNRLANCFVICRRVYCVSSYTMFGSKVSYYMDTTTGLEGFTNIPFTVKYGKLASIEYNPHDQLLYGWDNGHAVVYSLTFEEG